VGKTAGKSCFQLYKMDLTIVWYDVKNARGKIKIARCAPWGWCMGHSSPRGSVFGKAPYQVVMLVSSLNMSEDGKLQDRKEGAEKIYMKGTKEISWSGSSVGIATGYGLDGPGIEFRCGRDISHLSRPALGPTQLPVQWVPGLSCESGRGVTLTPHPLLVPRSKNRVALYLYSP
jgi:hypothetical protein